MSRITFRTILAALVAAAIAIPAAAHMEMTCPAPRLSQYIPGIAEPNIDRNNTSPTQAICQGKPVGPIVATYQAGSDIAVTVGGPTPHDGGHCQFAISYDNGNTFVVLKDIVGTCMIGSLNYTIPLPETAPASKHAIFAWTWINASGKREYYMNCADVVINGPENGTVTGPKLLVANILGGPTIPEWGTGTDNVTPALLAARPIITVSATGTVTNSTGNAGQNTTTNDNGAAQPGESTVPVPDNNSNSNSNTTTVTPGDVSNNTASTTPGSTGNSTVITNSTDANCTTNNTTVDTGAVNDNSTSTVPVPDNNNSDNTTIVTPGDVSNNTASAGNTTVTVPDNSTVITNTTENTTIPSGVDSNDNSVTPVPSAPLDINDIPVCNRGQTYVCTSKTDYVYCSGTRTVPLKCPSGSECQHDETGGAFCQQLAYRCAAHE